MMNSGKKTRFAVLYDYLQVAGGSERMALDLCRGLPGASLFVARAYAEAAALTGSRPDEIKALGSAITRPLGRILEAAYCFKYRTQFLSDAKNTYYLGNYAPLAASRQANGKKIYYCNTPPRFAYDWSAEYRSRQAPVLRGPFDHLTACYRSVYEQAVAQMDVVIANSENIRQRIKKYLNLDSQVIYPPVDVEKYRWLSQGDYFVSTARLMPYKRIRAIVEAFLKLPAQRLVILSGGPELASLQQLAADADNIHFTGWQSDAQLLDWIGNARAAIYIPKAEDFGISPVEAMAAGKPVIGVADGGLLETIVHEQTGLLLPPDPTTEELIAAICRLNPATALAMRGACEARARLFSRNIFLEKMLALAV
ncbi:MAG TPA: glycosyltransferase [Spongiibacteraceae bacterium]|nr:glycosyltransferase [Spongiibacteraceae bacterium]